MNVSGLCSVGITDEWGRGVVLISVNPNRMPNAGFRAKPRAKARNLILLVLGQSPEQKLVTGFSWF